MSEDFNRQRTQVPESTESETVPRGTRLRLIAFTLLPLLIVAVLGLMWWLQTGDDDATSTVAEESADVINGAALDETIQQESQTINRIAFIDPDGRLGTVAPDGSDYRLLTEAGRFFQFPAWSPSSASLAVIGSDFDESGVFITTDQPSNSVRQLYAHREQTPVYLYWSPDGERISFIAGHPEGLALHLVNADGASASEVLVTGQRGFFWDWLPDGQQALVHTGFTGRVDDLSRLAFIPLNNDLEPIEVTESGHFQTPAVSADGRFYAYGEAEPTGSRWLGIWATDNKKQQLRLLPYQGVIAMSWSPKDAILAYTSPNEDARSFYGPLRTVNMDTGEGQLLVQESVVAFFWAPDARSLSYLTVSAIIEPEGDQDGGQGFDPEGPGAQLPPADDDIVHNMTKGTAAKRAQQRTQVLLNLWVVDIADAEQTLLMTFEPSDTFLNQFLPFFDQYALSHRLWSPDSRSIVLPMKDGFGQDKIVVVPIDGSQAQAVADGDVAFWSQH